MIDGGGIDQAMAPISEDEDTTTRIMEQSGDYGAGHGDDEEDEGDEEEGIIIGSVPNPLMINRDPLAEELQTVQEMRRQLQEASEENGGFTNNNNDRKKGGRVLPKLRDSSNESAAANARKNGRFEGLKALQNKLQSDIDTEITELDSTKADLEAEYAALADEIAELEAEETNEEKKESMLEEKKIAMHVITEKMVEHEAAKVACDHAMRAAGKKKKVLDEAAGECAELRTKLDHVKSEMNSVEQELEHLKNDPEDDDEDGSNRRLGHHLTKEESEAKIAALKAKQQLLRDEEAKLDADEAGLLEEKSTVQQSVIDRAKSLITDLMTQDEAVKHALQTCLRTKINAEKEVETAKEEKEAVCSKVKSTAEAMKEAEIDVRKIDEFLKSTLGRKLRGGSGKSGKGTEL